MTDDEVLNAVNEQEKKKITLDEQFKVIEDFKNLKETFTEDYVKSKLNEQMSNALNLFS